MRPGPLERDAVRKIDPSMAIPCDWWLKPSLDKGHPCLVGVYCLGYRIGSGRDDPWTARINDFKSGSVRALRQAEATMQSAAPSLFSCIGINPEDTVLIPILGSSEETADLQSRNSRLAKAIADAAGASFEASCLAKRVHAPLHQQPDAGARDAVLKRAKYRAGKLEHSLVLLVDDIVTRGATMAKVAAAICLRNPTATIFGFALGRHQSPGRLHASIESANKGIPQELAIIWDQS